MQALASRSENSVPTVACDLINDLSPRQRHIAGLLSVVGHNVTASNLVGPLNAAASKVDLSLHLRSVSDARLELEQLCSTGVVTGVTATRYELVEAVAEPLVEMLREQGRLDAMRDAVERYAKSLDKPNSSLTDDLIAVARARRARIYGEHARAIALLEELKGSSSGYASAYGVRRVFPYPVATEVCAGLGTSQKRYLFSELVTSASLYLHPVDDVLRRLDEESAVAGEGLGEFECEMLRAEIALLRGDLEHAEALASRHLPSPRAAIVHACALLWSGERLEQGAAALAALFRVRGKKKEALDGSLVDLAATVLGLAVAAGRDMRAAHKTINSMEKSGHLSSINAELLSTIAHRRAGGNVASLPTAITAMIRAVYVLQYRLEVPPVLGWLPVTLCWCHGLATVVDDSAQDGDLCLKHDTGRRHRSADYGSYDYYDEYDDPYDYEYYDVDAPDHDVRLGGPVGSKLSESFLNYLKAPAQLTSQLCGSMATRAASAGLGLFTSEFGEASKNLDTVLGRVLENGANGGAKVADQGHGQVVPLASVLRPLSTWERKLARLRDAVGGGSAQAKSEANESARVGDSRVAWVLDIREQPDGGVLVRCVEPREQKLQKSGWSKGRKIGLKRLHEREVDCLRPNDETVAALVTREEFARGGWGRYVDVEYVLDPGRALPALVGHSAVYDGSRPDTPIELVSGEPELSVVRNDEGIEIMVRPSPPAGDGTISVLREGPSRLRVVVFRGEQLEVARVLGQRGLKVPSWAERSVSETLGPLASRITVHTDIAADGTHDAISTVEASSVPHVHLVPEGDGLRVDMWVRPLGQDGPMLRPGQGGSTVFAKQDGTSVRGDRDLVQERQIAETVVQQCVALCDAEANELEAWAWFVSEPTQCLELLAALAQLGDKVILEWPKGGQRKVSRAYSPNAFSLAVRGADHWLEASGELQLDDGRVLNLSQLIELTEASPGRFVRLGDAEFLQLTEGFKRRVDELRTYLRGGKGGTLRAHALAAPVLAEIGEDVGNWEADQSFSEQLARLRARSGAPPRPPKNLQAELRDYQVDGFRWLRRLADWQVGACLADDMGLGKTVQILALLLSRARLGPALVVAPTSVCPNWQSEARRFAPDLRVSTYERHRMDSLTDEAPKRGEVVLCTYGMLQQADHCEALSAVRWSTLVLDEAQAIKNPLTKRAQAARALEADFRVATTGTPIENHLGELWSLFAFLNPGLLGSSQDFSARYATPIANGTDPALRKRLSKLVRPFMLRRTKAQVLDELPPRTELIWHVDLSKDEAAFYEALRQRAVEKLSQAASAGGKENAGAQHLQILSELMRLRRACCNTKLVMQDSQIPCSKLAAFSELVGELRDNGHRALVFSQFVDHLKLVREHLDAAGITYQYLDGSTPRRSRQEAVEAFQAGDGDLFLISLRAGGTGLNLTAADYVVHLDPWWNPAVEDQASDRAHRIGQTRPVTVYRLVTRGTIEEKIVSLHGQKRELAESLLEGTDKGAGLSAKQLLDLMRQN